MVNVWENTWKMLLDIQLSCRQRRFQQRPNRVRDLPPGIGTNDSPIHVLPDEEAASFRLCLFTVGIGRTIRERNCRHVLFDVVRKD
jgi:hypothetical protein